VNAAASSHRLASGGLIERQKPLGFTFDGKSYRGFAGDTLASALLASGVRLVGRSFKYHRPRGILSAGSEEPNALVELRQGARREPNTRATTIELFEGLAADSQNRFPSLAFDVMAINSLFSPIFAAGFYYKTFMWPASFWEKVYEPMIRRAAGLGRAAESADPDRYEKANIHCDLLVIGAGPAGLMAALTAGRAGARVILCEEDFVLGGRCLAEDMGIGELPAARWAESMEAELAALPDVRIMRRTTVCGVYDGGTYGALERVGDHLALPGDHQPRQRFWRIIAKQSVLAAGAIERPLVFANNDRPGIMLAGSVRAYINRFAIRPGTRAVVFANNDDAWRTLSALRQAGVTIEAIVDPRTPTAEMRRLAECAEAHLVTGVVTKVRGGQRIHSLEVTTADGKPTTLACDLLAMSGGWNPAVHLTSHLGGAPVWNEALAAFLPGRLPPGMAVAGAAAGHFALADCLARGAEAGRSAAEAWGFKSAASPMPAVEPQGVAIAPLWRVKNSHGKAFVDFQNDVSADDVQLAEREGFRSVEHLKRYTTMGMATDQGKTSNVNGLALMAEFSHRSIAATGTTRFRPPYAPIAIGALAGHHRGKDFKPTRLPPSHQWAIEQGAVFVETGLWLRAQYFPKAGEKGWLETVSREVKQTRESVGVCDVSTLGKIDVQGPDAGVFLDRLYTNMFSTLAVGKARYGLMLREDGIVMDDGTTSRLGPDRFFMTTTTANAAKVMHHMEFCLQVLWPDLDAQCVSVSEQWGQFSIAGPRSREVLQRIVDDPGAIANEALPYLGVKELSVLGGIGARLFRISFSGEMAFELSLPARFGDGAIRAIMEAGREFAITPYGTEALGVMRIEKGHVAGSELNGQTTARDLGLGKMMSTKKDYIGRVMAGRPGMVDPTRPQVIGFIPVDRNQRLWSGAHFIAQGAEANARNDQGFMSAVAYSPMLGHWVGLGFLSRGSERMGEKLRACDLLRGGEVAVEACSPVFYDPKGERLHG
jgi:methylglutamate dehydrogenase subunit C